MFQKIKNFFQNNVLKYFFLAFLFALIILLINFYIVKPGLRFQYDSWGYFEVAGTFWETPLIIKFTNFHRVPRGYLLPFLIAFSTYPGRLFHFNQIYSYLISQQAFFAFALTVVLPSLFTIVFHPHENKNRWQIAVKAFIFFLTTFIFWRGMFTQALSDFPAVFSLTIALICFGLFLRRQKNLSYWQIIFYGLGSGFFAAASYYIRPSYLMSLITMVIFWILFTIIYKFSKKGIIFFFSLIIGILIVSFPQAMINYKYFHSWNPLVKTSLDSNLTGPSIMQLQLGYGLNMQKYETYDTFINDETAAASVRFYNSIGQHLLKIYPHATENYGNYFQLFLHHPLDMAAIYANHFFAGLDQKYPEIYITHLYRDTSVISLINYSLIFIFILYLIHCPWFHFPTAKFSKNENLFMQQLLTQNIPVWLTIILLASLAPSILGAVEPRFFLPLHLLIYGVAIFIVPYKQLWQKIKQRPWLHLFFYLAFLLICFTLSSNILANYNDQPILINNPKQINTVSSTATESAHAN